MSEQSDTAGPIGRISQHDKGLGTVTPELVEERALELAKTDGRTEANEKDLAEARAELLKTEAEPIAPELDEPEFEQVTEWDQAPESSGSRAPRVGAEDDANISQTLIEEGLEEADHDQRVSAADANPPEEE